MPRQDLTSPGAPREANYLDLTVVLPVRNEADHILVILDDLVRQTLSPDRFEILVCDGMSDDGTTALVDEFSASYPMVRRLDNPRRLSSAARNVGIRNARGRYLLYVDGHCRIPSPRLLEDVVEAFEQGANCISRPQPLVAGADTAVAQAIVLTRSSVLGHLPGSMIYSNRDLRVDPTSAGCGYSMRVVDEVGYFDESFDAAEDVEFNLRVRGAGFRALHSPRFAVEYVARSNLPDLARQMHRYGLGRARLLVRRRVAASLFAALPALLLLLAVTGLVLIPLLPAIRSFALIAIALPLAASLITAVAVSLRSNPAMGLLSIPSFLTILMGGASGFLAGLVRQGRSSHDAPAG